MQKNKINSSDISRTIAADHNYYHRDVAIIIDAFIAAVVAAVANGDDVSIKNLGRFRPGTRKWRGKMYPTAKFTATQSFKFKLRDKRGVQNASQRLSN